MKDSDVAGCLTISAHFITRTEMREYGPTSAQGLINTADSLQWEWDLNLL